MALVTVSRSPSGSGHSTPVGPADEGLSRRSQLQRRQSFAVLRGAVLGLQDRGEPSAGSDEEEDPEEKASPSDHPDGSGQGTPECPSPGKQEQRRHLHLMVGLLRAQDNIQLAVQLETPRPQWLRYLLVVSTSELLSQEETVLLGVDFSQSSPPSCTLGLVLPLWSDTQVYLDGDGGFTVTSGGQTRIFKPISIQTMWATLQVLHQACEMALGNGLVPGGSALAWTAYYQARITSDQSCINEWMAMADLESLRSQLPSADSSGHSEQERMERLIRAELGDVLDTSDLESVTSKEIRQALEGRLGCPLQQYRDFIDNQMLVLMAQRDRASHIFPHLYLGSEWNAANLDELQRNRVSHILNVAREIDNFYPELFTYHNVRLWDEETEQLLPHWKETHGFIEAARWVRLPPSSPCPAPPQTEIPGAWDGLTRQQNGLVSRNPQAAFLRVRVGGLGRWAEVPESVIRAGSPPPPTEPNGRWHGVWPTWRAQLQQEQPCGQELLAEVEVL
ncbi:protein phosphatase Slingshot homolog 3 [Gracilinanus agilis]|uniref:protein phosphatase Slingshot homolog 3 n=1 Tax=Gracilinanus agilis TaxID=191870 RepID=UPI001CFE157E|nr:protein phosphatase Slingshot homolog 3 [Gracilinanus agilis]